MFNLYINALNRFRGSGRPKSRFKQKLGGKLLEYGPGLITCKRFDTFLANYLDGGLSSHQLKVFEGHMVLCPMCRAHFQTYVATYEMTQLAFGPSSDPIPNHVPEELTLAVINTIKSAQHH